MSRRPFRIDVLAYDGCFASEIFTFTDTLRVANHIETYLSKSDQIFDVRICSPNRRTIRPAGVERITVSPPQARPDLLIVPGFDLVPSTSLDRFLADRANEVQHIRGLAHRRVPIASVCVGAFLLGEAGLLDGRKVTTAWLFEQRLRQRYPKALVDSSPLIIEDRGVTTTAAFNAANDLAAEIVTQFLPSESAQLVKKVLLLGNRAHDQTAYIDPRLMQRPGRFAHQVDEWLVKHLHEPYSLDLLAREFNMSTRTLLRSYKADAGRSPLSTQQQQRLARARQLLETTEDTFDEITRAVGYQDTATFRRLFTRSTGISPGAYRSRFQQQIT